MTFRTLASFLFIVGIAAGGCTSRARSSDRAADDVIAQQKDLNKQIDKDTAQTKAIDEQSAALGHANDVFAARKDVRMIGLKAEASMIAPQGDMITSLATQLPLTPAARADVDAKVEVLAHRVDEAQLKITDLQNSTAEQWKARDDAADGAMKNLEAARDDAWHAFKQAKRTDRSS